ncbi:ImmA/IrrE family metallo-endopeptidase [Streptomyces jumonjinensis]|uniref:ImmA/IrrE family metallo-endopeptidase n=1 Tax=Streptomyces jumonjinensis TaxID=1945 RepID=UPI003325CFEC
MRWSRSNRTARRDFHARCTEKLRGLELPTDRALTISSLCTHLSQQYGRPIQIVAAELPKDSPDGALLCTAEGDYILFEERLAPIHRRQVILHEFGHLVCGHLAGNGLVGSASHLLLPSLSPALVQRVMSRAHKDSEAEREAEYVGSLIGQKISTWETVLYHDVPPEAEALVTRLSTLEPFSVLEK